jgi:acyl-CoA thioester hydrolase
MGTGSGPPRSPDLSGIGDTLPRDSSTGHSDARWLAVRVYYEDTDAAGIVYYANYLRFMERARTEWLRELGFEIDQLSARDQLLFAVRSASIEYHIPCRLNDRLLVGVSVERIGPASLDLRQPVYRGETAVATGHIRLACLDAGTFKPRPMPQRVREKLTAKA